MAKKPRTPVRPAKRPGGIAAAMDPVLAQTIGSVVSRLQSGDAGGAGRLLEQGLARFPGNPDLLHLGAQAALAMGNRTAALELAGQAAKRAPRASHIQQTLGNVLFVTGAVEEALAHFRRAVKLEPNRADFHTSVGIALARSGRKEDAAVSFGNAVRLDPQAIDAHLNLAVCNVQLNRVGEVEKLIKRIEALAQAPDAALLLEIANLYKAIGRPEDAERFLRRALELAPQNATLWFVLGELLVQAGRLDEGEGALIKARASGYPDAHLHLAFARLASHRGQIESARQLLGQALALAEDSVPLLSRIAAQYSVIGDFDAEERCLRRILELEPGEPAAYTRLALAPGRAIAPAELVRLQGLLRDSSLDPQLRSRIGFALGSFFNHAGQYDEAFSAYRQGNRLKGYSFDLGAYAARVDRVRSMFGSGFFSSRADWGSDSGLPLLIVGMPRSGTTLVEQILDSHTAVHGAGELGTVAALSATHGQPAADFMVDPEAALGLTAAPVAAHATAYLEKMHAVARRGEQYVANKLPHNFEQLGLFGLLFPHAPVIHVTRDPRDTLLSIYFQDFVGTHAYAYDLEVLGAYFNLYRRLVDHWLSVIPNPVLTVRYEGLVEDLGARSREMTDFLGLAWEPQMLDFHRLERRVETASGWQVRQPLYQSSVGRWKRYEAHLGPLLEALEGAAS